MSIDNSVNSNDQTSPAPAKRTFKRLSTYVLMLLAMLSLVKSVKADTNQITPKDYDTPKIIDVLTKTGISIRSKDNTISQDGRYVEFCNGGLEFTVDEVDCLTKFDRIRVGYEDGKITVYSKDNIDISPLNISVKKDDHETFDSFLKDKYKEAKTPALKEDKKKAKPAVKKKTDEEITKKPKTIKKPKKIVTEAQKSEPEVSYETNKPVSLEEARTYMFPWQEEVGFVGFPRSFASRCYVFDILFGQKYPVMANTSEHPYMSILDTYFRVKTWSTLMGFYSKKHNLDNIIKDNERLAYDERERITEYLLENADVEYLQRVIAKVKEKRQKEIGPVERYEGISEESEERKLPPYIIEKPDKKKTPAAKKTEDYKKTTPKKKQDYKKTAKDKTVRDTKKDDKYKTKEKAKEEYKTKEQKVYVKSPTAIILEKLTSEELSEIEKILIQDGHIKTNQGYRHTLDGVKLPPPSKYQPSYTNKQ